MEQQRGEERDRGVPKFVKISQVKLPLAPPADKRPNVMVSTRRGISIFSPTQAQQPTAEADPAQISSPRTPGPQPRPNSAAQIKYRECLKNHAARNGGHVVDGCGEFMPNGDAGMEESLTCSACNCHRNFHRREVVPRQSNNNSHRPTPVPLSSNPPNNSHKSGPAQPRMVKFGGGDESSSEELNAFQSSDASGSKKRLRTKFSKEQKDRMNKLAGKFGWRIQKQDEEEVERVCSEIGVTREVFRVWMNNCKQTANRKRRAS